MAQDWVLTIFPALVAWVILANIECMFLHVRYGGNMKRGVKVWTEPLPADMRRFLRRLSTDLLNEKTGVFIRKQDNTVLVQHVPTKKWWLRRGGALPYVAYIDLREKDPRIQYRVPISPLPFFALWITVAAWASFQDVWLVLFVVFGLLMLYGNHVYQRKRILKLISDGMRVQYGATVDGS